MMTRMKRKQPGSFHIALVPYTIWAVLFILIPMGFVVFYAFTDSDFQFTCSNLIRFFTAVSSMENAEGNLVQVKTYLFILGRSLNLAFVSTIICLLIGYPLAFLMTQSGKKIKNIMLLLLTIPMWMNFLIRTYAWMTILQDTGVLNHLIVKLGFRPFHIIGTKAAVVIGMVYDYIPYMVFPIYSVMTKMDQNLIEAAKDLGCSKWRVFQRVIFPFSIPGILSGITMVLIPSVSTFYISQKLGNGKIFLIGDAIEGQYLANNLHFAAVMAFLLMILLMVVMGILKLVTEKCLYGGAAK